MFRTHLKFFTRVFLKDKFFSTLNILGLALGIAVSIILLLILQNDLTYDQYHVNHKRIYRLGGHLEATGVDFKAARSARELGNILKEEFPEVQEVVRANSWDHTLVKYQSKTGEEKAFYEENIVRTDSTYFSVFTHTFIAGNPTTCLSELNTLVLTESTAKKYFGDENALDQSLIIDGESWKVTGVIQDVPPNTHLKFDMLVSRLVDREWVMDQGKLKSEAFWNPDVYTYLLVPDNYDPKNFYDKFPAIFDKYFKSFGDQVGGKYTPILESLASIHFHSTLDSDEPHGNIAYLYAFAGIGLFIIILACINYMNLSTAKSVNRAAEIAMKKTLGSGKTSLVFSFLGESVFLSLISLIVAIALVFFVLDATPFNQLVDKNLSADFLHNPLLLFGSLGIAVGIGIISGLYPAFYLPNIPTLQALKGSFKNQSSSLVLRKVLITAQFAISIFVVVCTLFMQDQIDYVRNKELGFDKENVLLLPIQDTLVQRQLTGIKSEFLQNPHITGATTSYNVFGMGMGGPVMWAEGAEGMKQQAFTLMVVGEDYFKTMGIEILKGRDFLPGPKADVDDVFIANEAAAKLMGWGDDAIGKKVKFFHAKTDGQVVGLVKDFNFASLHNAVEPLIIIKAREEGGYLHLKVKGDDLINTVSYIKEKWLRYDPNHPFEYFFLDQRFDEQYRADETQYKLLSGLSWICIFISLLGLLGLSAFTAAQRTKEIGVRKVHGATIPNIIYLLFKEVMYLVVIAAIIIIPISLYTISQWMGNFAYQTNTNYMIFAVVGILALLFAFITVAFHSLKTARTNPVNSLRSE
ncbi:MAG TPA: ABC transporter permease [Chryseolinea sp.]|nr:ABC transporter permease [Chryseolinea sp.]HPH45753.1 ABC transporter permease [Chryseolinea sp.]HPM31092.1 ABC transporter permease [Chryseolinea sp.]